MSWSFRNLPSNREGTFPLNLFLHLQAEGRRQKTGVLVLTGSNHLAHSFLPLAGRGEVTGMTCQQPRRCLLSAGVSPSCLHFPPKASGEHVSEGIFTALTTPTSLHPPRQLLAECHCRATEADRAEENITWAQERARAEEERALPVPKAGVGDDLPQVGLPPGERSGSTVHPQDTLLGPGDNAAGCC